ncbi:unnamed protein product [Prorocentrum cordatum]|uniref:Uncharacterized protein n=1 Tax=Prorocentrum cordatum TaxID=2364126 RepID=A0ABN9QKV4_9DINO|nr:unnamed protein product [Polarella glacialis]CAK0825652.1 unnamed protein product [Polarella glacialis]
MAGRHLMMVDAMSAMKSQLNDLSEADDHTHFRPRRGVRPLRSAARRPAAQPGDARHPDAAASSASWPQDPTRGAPTSPTTAPTTTRTSTTRPR